MQLNLKLQVVKENEQSEPVQTTGEGLLDKAKAAVGLGQSKQVSFLWGTWGTTTRLA